MAVTFTIEALPGYPQSVGAKIELIAKITLSGTYDTGGFTPSGGGTTFGFSGVELIEGSYEVNNHLRWLGFRGIRGILQVAATGSELANGTNVTGDEYIVKVRGL